jgi:CBS domain-containing protein
MTPDPEALGQDESVLAAINLIATGNYRALPLTDADGRLAGLLTGRDLVAYVTGLLDR